MRRFLGSCSLVLALAGCHGRQSPDDTFRAFTLAVLSHQADAAWALLSRNSQELLAQATKQAAAAAPAGDVPADPKAYLFGEDAALARPLKDIKILDQSDQVAHLEVTTENEKHVVKMVTEEQGWKLDLADSPK